MDCFYPKHFTICVSSSHSHTPMALSYHAKLWTNNCELGPQWLAALVDLFCKRIPTCGQEEPGIEPINPSHSLVLLSTLFYPALQSLPM